MRVVRVPQPRTAPAPSPAVPPAHAAVAEQPVQHRAAPFLVPCDETDLAMREQRAYERGRAEGEQVRETALQVRLAELRKEADERTSALIEGVAAQLGSFAASVERDAFHFALAVASRIMKKEIQIDSETIVRQVRDAIHRVVGAETIRIRVHPQDEAVMRASRNALLGSVDSIRDCVVEADEGIEPGGCIIESASGNVDARIATQLRQIETALFGETLVVEERVV